MPTPNRLYSVQDSRRLFYPSRSDRWVKDTFTDGSYGPVIRDGAGWMISEVALVSYQTRHEVGTRVVELRAGQRALVERQKSAAG